MVILEFLLGSILKLSITVFAIYKVYNFFTKKRVRSPKKKKDIIPNIPREKQEHYSFTSAKKKFKFNILNPYRGIMIIGGAGSGKSRTFIYPIIKQSAEMGYCGVLYDFKSPELMNLAEKSYINSDVKINKIDFKNPKNSQRVNPISYIESAIHSTNYAQAFVFNLLPEYIKKQDFWSRSMVSLFSGAMWYFKKNEPKYATLPHIFAFFFSLKAEEIVSILYQDIEVRGYISSLTEAIEQGAEKQVAGVLGTLKNAIGIYNNPTLFWLLSSDETNLNVNDPSNKTMLLIGNDSTLSETYAPLCSIIITICSKLMNQPDKAKSIILLDETPTIYLPNFEQIPATARSNKVACILGFQDISQMVDKYGREKTEVLMSNLGNQMYGRTTNRETAERVVAMFGKYDEVKNVYGKSGNLLKKNHSQNQTIVKTDRIKIQTITNFESGMFACLIAEGAEREFYTRVGLQEMPTSEVPKFENNYTEEIAQNRFNEIYTDIENLKNNFFKKVDEQKRNNNEFIE